MTWYQELANELKSVVEGGQHDVPAVSINNLIESLESGEAEESQVMSRLREFNLNWFANRLANNEFHDRGVTND